MTVRCFGRFVRQYGVFGVVVVLFGSERPAFDSERPANGCANLLTDIYIYIYINIYAILPLGTPRRVRGHCLDFLYSAVLFSSVFRAPHAVFTRVTRKH